MINLFSLFLIFALHAMEGCPDCNPITEAPKVPVEVLKMQQWCIKGISEILNHIPEHVDGSEILVAFDWDQTISRKEGRHELRDTLFPSILKKLYERKMKSMIITARVKGLSLHGGETNGKSYSGAYVRDTIQQCNNDMLKAMGMYSA